MESMTGYAIVEKRSDQFSFTVEIKSLNSRYLEINMNLPRPLRNLEFTFNDVLKEIFSRGKLELTIELFNWKNKNPVSLNHDAIETYYHELSAIRKKLGVTEPLRLDTVILLEGITQKNNAVVFEEYHPQIMAALNETVKKTIDMRRREGISIKKDLDRLVRAISRDTVKIRSLARKQKKEKIDRLREKIMTITRNRVDDGRIYSEVAMLAEKLDINEEIVRIGDHLKKFREVAASREQIGRKLDFLAQEIFREINTIGSKSNSAEISQQVVNVKDTIEKIREQCRNII